MYCSEFLEIYSDYRDGRIADPKAVQSVERHLRSCKRCMDYDALVARGVMALRATSDVEPAHALRRSWDERSVGQSAALSDHAEVRHAHAGIMVALMVATGLALLVWSVRDREAEVAAVTPVPPVAESAVVAAPAESNPRTSVTRHRVELSDWSVPAFADTELPAPEQAVPFETWVTLPR